MLVGASGKAFALKRAVPELLRRFVTFRFALPRTKLIEDPSQRGLAFKPKLVVEWRERRVEV